MKPRYQVRHQRDNGKLRWLVWDNQLKRVVQNTTYATRRDAHVQADVLNANAS